MQTQQMCGCTLRMDGALKIDHCFKNSTSHFVCQACEGDACKGSLVQPVLSRSYAACRLLQQKKQVLWQSQFTAGEQYWWLFEEGGVRELTPTEARLVGHVM